jgi:hypothetical protein
MHALAFCALSAGISLSFKDVRTIVESVVTLVVLK